MAAMIARKTVHDSFTLERTLKAPPARVFHAFADDKAKMKWFDGGPEWQELAREFDFREGGRERAKGLHTAHNVVSDFQCFYHEIAPNQRIIYSYKMWLNDVPISVSLATIEFAPAGAGTKLTMTEHGVFLDDFDDNGGRKEGTNEKTGFGLLVEDTTSIGAVQYPQRDQGHTRMKLIIKERAEAGSHTPIMRYAPRVARCRR